jgi:hypothetical protein
LQNPFYLFLQMEYGLSPGDHVECPDIYQAPPAKPPKPFQERLNDEYQNQ